MAKTARKIEVSGLVQGVGFRPFIFRLAHQYNLQGTVENNNRGVYIHIEGLDRDVHDFIEVLPGSIPEASSIAEFTESETEVLGFEDFSIVKSSSSSDEVTEVSPDIGICKACLDDMKNQPHRIGYPFTNCTNCGPRFTIIKDLPYDRHQTTMEPFRMCETCRQEYTNILDRRFHAQPVACNQCGPQYTLHLRNRLIVDHKEILHQLAQMLEEGKLIAMKGLGGYHLACNPLNENSVAELRKRKNREGKPFALMFRDIASIREYLHLSEEEESLVTSWRRPIVLLKVKKSLSPSIAVGLDTVGAMLPYMPFHYQLFEKLRLPAVVLTSGNLSDEPIIIDNKTATERLGPISDAVLTYNREIHNRTDDSVALVADKQSRIIRRSRSYAPSPTPLGMNTEGIFAAGAELVNCFAIGKGNNAIISQHIGDLQNLETLEFYSEAVDRHKRLFRFEPQLAVMDLHPDYLSTRYAQQMGIPVIAVQHHHAHIASCMAEYGLDEKVIGISFDGTGYGSDGNIWGGEFMVCDLLNFERTHHLEYIPQPGGDAVTKHPWRMMLAYLHHYFGKNVLQDLPLLFHGLNGEELNLVLFALEKKLNSPLTSSMGRLFDTVSALLGVCRNASYHAEAPMQLEAIADVHEKDSYPFSSGKQISLKPAFEVMIRDLQKGIGLPKISGKFHQTVVEIIIHTAMEVREQTGIQKVALSGGSFQNRILLTKSIHILNKEGFEVFSQSNIPSNDGGIALGQMAIGAKRREMGLI